MKKTSLLIALLAFTAWCANAQATFEHSYGPTIGGFSRIVLLTSNGEKIANTDGSALRLYNMDHTLWKTITLPPLSGYDVAGVPLVSDRLFNSDDAVELVAIYVTSVSGTHPQYKTQLIGESGTVLQAIDTGYGAEVHYNQQDDNYKLFVQALIPGIGAPYYTGYRTSVYSVPGTLPCGKCGASGTERVSGQAGTRIGLSDPTPNPSSGITRIDYQLPIGISDAQLLVYNVEGNVVKVQPLVPQSAFVLLDNSGFVPGVYTYVVRSGMAMSEVRKMIVK